MRRLIISARVVNGLALAFGILSIGRLPDQCASRRANEVHSSDVRIRDAVCSRLARPVVHCALRDLAIEGLLLSHCRVRVWVVCFVWHGWFTEWAPFSTL